MTQIKSLLSVSSDSKTIKGEAFNVLTGILYLAPADTVNGINTCPMAEIANCKSACLYTAGRGAFNSVQKARINKTIYFRDNRNNFMLQLVYDIAKLKKKAQKLGYKLAIRLNGTSDIKWENISFEFEGIVYDNIMAVFPDVQFYDYTKLPNRITPSNYDLTFSYSGVDAFNKYNDKALSNGMRVAVVFNNKAIPNTFKGIKVINGDESDVRFNDAQGIIVGLYAKGKARKDNTGFVVSVDSIDCGV
jgi:hypothetical protein